MQALPEHAITLVDGLMLGSGCLIGPRLQLQRPPAEVAWVTYIAQALREVGLQSHTRRLAPRVSTVAGTTKGALQLTTRSYTALAVQHRRWYPGGVKRVPADVRLTPRTLALWYWASGSVTAGGRLVRLSARKWPYADVERLAQLLHERYRWDIRIHDGRRLAIQRRRDRIELRQLVTSFAPSCFRRKLAISSV